MVRELSFTVPGAPKGKGRPRLTRKGIAYTPRDTVVYENLVKLSFSQAYPSYIPSFGCVKAEIRAFYPIPKSFTKLKRESALYGFIYPTKKPDSDNIAKSILDSLNNLAYADDSQVIHLEVTKLYSDTPRVEVVLYIEEVKQNAN